MSDFSTLRKQIGKKIKSLRIEANLKQIDLATKIGISRQHLSTIENGSANWTVDDLIKILIMLKSENLISSLTEEMPISPILLEKIERKSKKRVRK